MLKMPLKSSSSSSSLSSPMPPDINPFIIIIFSSDLVENGGWNDDNDDEIPVANIKPMQAMLHKSDRGLCSNPITCSGAEKEVILGSLAQFQSLTEKVDLSFDAKHADEDEDGDDDEDEVKVFDE